MTPGFNKWPLSIISGIVMIVGLNACSHYYKAIVTEDIPIIKISEFNAQGKYIILRRDSAAWHMTNIAIIDDTLKAQIDYQIGYMAYFLYPEVNKLKRFDKKIYPLVGNCVQLFTIDDSFDYFDKKIAIPLSSIVKMQDHQYKEGLSVFSFAFPITVTVIGSLVLIFIIISNSITYSITI